MKIMGPHFRRQVCSILRRVAMVTALISITMSGAAQFTASNWQYTMHVSRTSEGFGVGTWNVITGPSHPAGGSRNILYSGTTTGTNYSSLRVYKTPNPPVDYFPGGANNLDAFVASEGPSPIGPAGLGYRTVWIIPGEGIRMTQDVFLRPDAVFASYENASVMHTVEIENIGALPIKVGFRNLYDWALSDGFEDGPNAQIEDVCGGSIAVPATTEEFSHAPVTGGVCRLSVDPGVPTYQAMMALNFDPGFWPGLPITVPDEMAFVWWPAAYGTAFDFTVVPGFDINDDSCTLTWFGRTDPQGIVINPASSTVITQAIFAVPPDGCVDSDFNSARSPLDLYE